MKVAILGGKPTAEYYSKLDKEINRLIEQSQCYLFYILCGRLKNNYSTNQSLGELWAIKNGAPIKYIKEESIDKLIDKALKQADYIIFILEKDNTIINNAFMKYKMMGKHGSVIRAAGLNGTV